MFKAILRCVITSGFLAWSPASSVKDPSMAFDKAKGNSTSQSPNVHMSWPSMLKPCLNHAWVHLKHRTNPKSICGNCCTHPIAVLQLLAFHVEDPPFVFADAFVPQRKMKHVIPTSWPPCCASFLCECMQELAAMPMPCGEQRESDGAGWVNTEPMKGPYLTWYSCRLGGKLGPICSIEVYINYTNGPFHDGMFFFFTILTPWKTRFERSPWKIVRKSWFYQSRSQ